MYIDDDTKSPRYYVQWSVTAPTGTVHLWNVGPIQGAELRNKFPATDILPGFVRGNSEYTVGEPASSAGCVAVGAHTVQSRFRNYQGTLLSVGTEAAGAIADFSSIGPLMDGRMKPDITGPGHTVGSAVSFFDTDLNDLLMVQKGSFDGRSVRYAMFSGTSMSSPMVAGAVALMLEKNPQLTYAQVLDILKTSARTDDFTGSLPATGHTVWGWGKLDVFDAVSQTPAAVTLTTGKDRAEELNIYPNPAQSELQIELPAAGNWKLTLLNVQGQTLFSETVTADQSRSLHRMSLSGRTAGIYFLQAENGNRIVNRRFIRVEN
jgi:subtilisin family serine protease